jgi:hypothetical protein
MSLIGSGIVSHAWFPASATGIYPMSDADMANTSYYVGYIRKYATSCKCGCRDTACTQSYWQIQQFKR